MLGMLAILSSSAAVTGCGAKYVTPGAGVAPGALADWDVEERFERRPAAPFPARLAVVRVQAPGYRSYSSDSYGYGRYSVMTTLDVERDEHFERLAALPMVAGVARLNRLVIPAELRSDRELRQAAAALRTDVLVVYTLDTSFRVDDHDIGPLGPITLGFLPNQEAIVVTTASAGLFDVRTGFVYGLAEATSRTTRRASVWTSRDAVDDARRETEAAALHRLLGELERTWNGILDEHARPAPATGA